MSQYAYILVVLSLVFLFLLNKYEKERLQRLYQEQLLKDETFRSDIKEKIHTTENINDVIAHINKTYHLGILLEITELRDAFFSDFFRLYHILLGEISLMHVKFFCNFLYFFKMALHFF